MAKCWKHATKDFDPRPHHTWGGKIQNLKYAPEIEGLYSIMQSAGKRKEEKRVENHRPLVCGEPLVKISDHLKNYKNLLKFDEEFGYYLAGLIEGSGKFNKEILEIEFDKKDIKTLFWLKKRIGVGTVSIKEEKIKLIIKNKKGLENIIKLINGKFLTDVKLKEWKNHEWEKDFNFIILPTFDPSLLQNNSFVAGYFDTCGKFKIEIEPQIKLESKIEGVNLEIIEKIKMKFGGEIVNNKYSSTSLTQARYFIEYFDKYSLCTIKYIEFIKWRDCYRILQREEHTTEKGIEKLKNIKTSLEKLTSL